MGLFSKKTFVCQQCGREYEARLGLGAGICPMCKEKLKDAKKEVEGYARYGGMIGRDYSEEELRAIAKHRDGILEQYKNQDIITREELKTAGGNYKKLSEEEAVNIYTRAMRAALLSAWGAYYTADFFCLTSYEGVMVDVRDIFAVGYTTDFSMSSNDTEAILCAVFTNDPYVPVFPIVHAGKIGFFALSKSKKGRQRVEALYNVRCPNLAYPAMSLKDLKKTVKSQGSGGKIETSDMLKYISDAAKGNGIFCTTKYITDSLPDAISNKLSSCGYIPGKEVISLLKMDKIFAGTFWEDIAQKSAESRF